MRIRIRQKGERLRRATFTRAELQFSRPLELVDMSTWFDVRPVKEFVQTAPDGCAVEFDSLDAFVADYLFDRIGQEFSVSVTVRELRYDLRMFLRTLNSTPAGVSAARFESTGAVKIRQIEKSA